MRILIIDDDYVSRLKLKTLLSEYGDCDAASDGELALLMFAKAHQESVPYDLITVDISMPGLDGHDVVREIRQQEAESCAYKTGHEARILMVTIRRDSKDVAASFLEGCEGYLVKPVTAKKIRETLETVELV